MINLNLYNQEGFSNTFQVFNQPDVLSNIKKMIYDYTKNELESHDSNLSIDNKLKLRFKNKVNLEYQKKLRRYINYSEEFDKIINNEEIKKKFSLIFKNPVLLNINNFRVHIPTEGSPVFPYHQDQATWFLFKEKVYQDKPIGTMWLSINGADESNSIEIIKRPNDKLKLFDHKHIVGKGYFGANLSKKFLDNHKTYRVNTQPGEALIFNNFTIHRTVKSENNNNMMVPRYSIDLRYYDEDKLLTYDVDYRFKIKKILRKIKII